MDDKLIDALLLPYFKKKFENSFFDELEYEYNGIWKGFYIQNKNSNPDLILGKPISDIGDTWFSSGEYFGSGPKIVGIEWNLFFEAMKRYIDKNYPLVYIDKIV